MKTVKLVKAYCIALMMVAPFLMLSCSEDKPNSPSRSDEFVNHYDLWVSVGEYAGTKKAKDRLVKGVESLEEKKNITFEGTGVEVSSDLLIESIEKDGYYYQIPKSSDRIGKYRITNEKVEVIDNVKIKNNTLQGAHYAHAWINKNTVILFGADGEYQKILWIKLDAKDMKILDEGTLNIAPPMGKYKAFTSSGLAGFRKSDNKIIYSYAYKTVGGYKGTVDYFCVAFVNPETMEVEKTIEEHRVEFMAGTAYGELLQHKTFFDKNGNYYIACNSVLPNQKKRTAQRGNLVRIKKGEMEFDPNYLGFKHQGKIITVDYMRNNKALLYIQDPQKTGSDWNTSKKNPYNCYYATLDLETDELKEIKLPYSQGVFAQRSVVVNDKAYIGINPKKEQPAIYVYDINTEKLTKGLTIQEGISFDRIVKLNK